MTDHPHRQRFLAVVAPVHHEAVDQTLDDGALALAESLDGISTSRVRDVDRGANLDVVAILGGRGQIYFQCSVAVRVGEVRRVKDTKSSLFGP